MTERDLQDAVVHYAQLLGWMTYHTYDSRRSGAGFPDLVLVRGSRLIFAELKSEKGRVSPAQRTWLEHLKETGAEVWLWYPSDWPKAIARTLA